MINANIAAIEANRLGRSITALGKGTLRAAGTTPTRRRACTASWNPRLHRSKAGSGNFVLPKECGGGGKGAGPAHAAALRRNDGRSPRQAHWAEEFIRFLKTKAET